MSLKMGYSFWRWLSKTKVSWIIAGVLARCSHKNSSVQLWSRLIKLLRCTNKFLLIGKLEYCHKCGYKQYCEKSVSDTSVLFLHVWNTLGSLKIDWETWAPILWPTKYMNKSSEGFFIAQKCIMYLCILLVKEQAERKYICDQRIVFLL